MRFSQAIPLCVLLVLAAGFAFGQTLPRCPIEATTITPHVYTFRNVITSGPEKGGWTPFNVMAVELTVTNVSNQDVAAMWFDFVRSDGITLASWDGVHRAVRVGQQSTIYFDNYGHFIQVAGTEAVHVHLTKIRYANGMLANFYPCDLGATEMPAPFRPKKARPDSAVLEIGNGIDPPRVLESQLPSLNTNMRPKTSPFQSWRKPVDSSKTVTFSIVVGEDGEPRDIKVKAGALGGTLDEDARQALTKWYFAPAMKDGQPVAVRIDVSFTATHTADGGFGWGAGWPFGQDN